MLTVTICPRASIFSRRRTMVHGVHDRSRRYVHAIAHALGGMYHIPHGEACAIALPVVLAAYGRRVTPKLARIADHLVLGGTTKAEKAENLLQRIVQLNGRMGIPATVAQLREKDIPSLHAGP